MRTLTVAVTLVAAMAFSATAMACAFHQKQSVKAPQEVVQSTPAPSSATTEKKG
jgi:hypothetical protein